MPDSSIMGEGQAMAEYLKLQRDPIAQGVGVPHGGGERVLVIPGLLSNDLYLTTMRSWLGRIGYSALPSEILLNVGCPRRIAADVTERIVARLAKEDTPIAILGHSRGGLLGKTLATRLGDKVSHLILVGSPLGGFLNVGPDGVEAFADYMQQGSDALQWVMKAGMSATRMFDPECRSPTCACEYYDDLYGDLHSSTRVTSIYSKNDPVVPPVSAHMPYGQNVVVSGTHSGLMFNREVYPHIAKTLAVR